MDLEAFYSYADPGNGLSTAIHSHLAIRSIWQNPPFGRRDPKRALTSVRVHLEGFASHSPFSIAILPPYFCHASHHTLPQACYRSPVL